MSPDKTQTTIRMPKVMDELLKDKSESTGVSKNSLILMAVSKWLKEEREVEGA